MEKEKDRKEIKTRGRQPMAEIDKATERLNLRLTKNEMAILKKRLQTTANLKTLTDLAKNIIFERKIVVYTRDKDLDITIREIVKLRNEMNAIGKNFNQIAKRINTYNEQFLYKKEFTEIEKHFDKFKELQIKLVSYFDLLADKWLQK
ncbi:beta-glucosidase-like glycosyl hydrolase [Pedobacter sp. CG_S7]|uniref:plasmid mobilization protein n=1 Tax=Pedobacter sp. CG_S7 TaxID=3143930 RepID=UPI00339466D0